MAEQSTLTSNPSKRQHDNQAGVQIETETKQENQTEADIAARLEYYAPVIGAFKDDPMLDAMMANIRERRREINADDSIR